MKRIIIAILLLLVLQLFSQESEDLNLQDVTIEGEDDKRAEFHTVERDISKHDLIEYPNLTRFKYFAEEHIFSYREAGNLIYRSYTELFLGTSEINFRTAFKDSTNRLIDFSAGYKSKKLDSGWLESESFFKWNPTHWRVPVSIAVNHNQYELPVATSKLSGISGAFDLMTYLDNSKFEDLYLKLQYMQSDYFSQTDLYDLELQSTYGINDKMKTSLSLRTKTDNFIYSGDLTYTGSNFNSSLWVGGDNSKVIPSIGFNWQKDLLNSGLWRIANTPIQECSSYFDDVSDYHFLNLSHEVNTTKLPVNMLLGYSNSQVLPFSINLRPKYYFDYQIINQDSTKYSYHNFPLLSVDAEVGYKLKNFHIKNRFVYNYTGLDELEFVNGDKYEDIPYIPEIENLTNVDIKIDKFTFSSLFAYYSSRYNHLNIELDNSMMLDCSLEYELKRTISIILYANNILNESFYEYSNYAKDITDFGLGIKITLQ
ncbi:MAG: hypothetical protein P9L91_03525 [Candidatus Zophobacter franzmannii]|nr:hypothetical protein [Candidatus Zophobacter franzmannii]